MALISGKQLRDASIAIAKLAFGVLRPDVAVAWTVAQNAGSQRLTSLGAPTAPTDAARLQDVQNIPWKAAVNAASTGNLTLSGTQTVDGVALIAGDFCLAKDQTAPEENGVYVVAAGAWSRRADLDSTAEVQSAVVSINQGTANANKRFYQEEDAVVVDTDPQTWIDIGTGGSAAYPTEDDKDLTASVTTAAGDIMTASAITSTPSGDGYVRVYINGVAVVLGDGVDTADCYFSADSGATAKSIAGITAGDELYQGSGLPYNLDANDRIDFDYLV